MEPFSKSKMAGKGSLAGLFAAAAAYIVGRLCGVLPCVDIPGAEETLTGLVVAGLTAGLNLAKQKAKGR